MIYDTNFLVALQGRMKRCPRADALAWAAREDAGEAYIPRIVEMEFLAGFEKDADAALHLRAFTVLPMDDEVLDVALVIMRELRGAGQGIGAADSIIAATARLYGLPLVTDNTRHFSRVAGLDVRRFGPV